MDYQEEMLDRAMESVNPVLERSKRDDRKEGFIKCRDKNIIKYKFSNKNITICLNKETYETINEKPDKIQEKYSFPYRYIIDTNQHDAFDRVKYFVKKAYVANNYKTKYVIHEDTDNTFSEQEDSMMNKGIIKELLGDSETEISGQKIIDFCQNKNISFEKIDEIIDTLTQNGIRIID